MAGRLQTAAPELTDLSKETAETLALYGADPDKHSFLRLSFAQLCRRH